MIDGKLVLEEGTGWAVQDEGERKGTPFLLLILNRYLAATLLSVEVLKYMASTSCLSKSHIIRSPLYVQQQNNHKPSSNLNQSPTRL